MSDHALPSRRRHRWLRIANIALATVALFVIIVASVFALMGIGPFLTILGTTPPHDTRGITNVLLLGIGDKNHDAADLTDAMMLVSLDPKTRSAVLLSIPRDLFVGERTDVRAGRINALYEQYKAFVRTQTRMSETGASLVAMRETGNVIGEKLGIPIHGVLLMDFTGFVKIIDALGGVDVEVSRTIVDAAYPIREGEIGTFAIDVGPHHLDGETALQYARSRHSSTDFDRSMRQQQMLKSLAQKVESQGILRDVRLVRSLPLLLHGHFLTTLTGKQFLGVLETAASTRMLSILTMRLNFDIGTDVTDAAPGGFVTAAAPNLYESGAAILIPVSIPAMPPSWNQIQTLTQLLVDHRQIFLTHSRIWLRPLGTTMLDAHRLKNELLRYGFDAHQEKIVAKQNHELAVEQSSITFARGADTPAASFLGELLNMPVTLQPSTASGGIAIMLGRDYRYAPIVSLLRRMDVRVNP
ncbi:LCP family protein [Candidatus Peregrinibacteria bacterium]|nr:LCP family protein [Candidatus Peregrinibacteria bacterium]